jgi:hypothetical protein
MILIMYLWAFNHPKKNHVVRFAVVWIQRLYIAQLACIAVTQIHYIIVPLKEKPHLYDIMFFSGLILNTYDLLSVNFIQLIYLFYFRLVITSSQFVLFLALAKCMRQLISTISYIKNRKVIFLEDLD